MIPVLETAPVLEPVSLEDMKAYLRLDDSFEDALLTSLIVSARETVEAVTGRALLTQAWSVSLDAADLEKRAIALPKAPLQSVTKISAFADDDTEIVWGAENYFVERSALGGRVVLRNGSVWPEAMRCADGVRIFYKAGYGDAPSDVPEALRLALKQLVADRYENRGDEDGGKLPSSVSALLAAYRMMRVSCR